MAAGRLLWLLAAMAALPMTAASAAPRAPAAARDWSRTVTMTPSGGMRMGNPAARVKLVEYGSLACPHCRHFEQTGYAPLVGHYVRTGRVSYEFRNVLISGPDIAVSLLARCGGAGAFFPRATYIFDTQPEWQQRIASRADAEKATLDAMTDQQRVVRFAQLGELDRMAARFGMAPVQAKRCLTDSRQLQLLLDMTQASFDAGVHGTPTFLINGDKADAATWEELEPLIRKAGGA